MMTISVLVILGWLSCSIISYGLLYAWFRSVSTHPDDEPYDHRGAVWLSICGPLSLAYATVIAISARTGFTLRRSSHD